MMTLSYIRALLVLFLSTAGALTEHHPCSPICKHSCSKIRHSPVYIFSQCHFCHPTKQATCHRGASGWAKIAAAYWKWHKFELERNAKVSS
jgi:hypothetical protein